MTRRTISLLATGCVACLVSCQTTAPAPNRFDMADANRDGRLTRDETTVFLVAELFAARDANHDGLMTEAEWKPNMDAAARRRFKEWDANHDGVVSLQEATAHAKKAGTCDDLFREADTNKDGFVTRAEATAYLASKEGPMR